MVLQYETVVTAEVLNFRLQRQRFNIAQNLQLGLNPLLLLLRHWSSLLSPTSRGSPGRRQFYAAVKADAADWVSSYEANPLERSQIARFTAAKS